VVINTTFSTKSSESGQDDPAVSKKRNRFQLFLASR